MSANGENLTTAQRLNRFAFDLYDRLQEESGNQFLSPFSIAVCLSMAGAGARGETARQFFKALHLPADDERLHAGLGELIRRLSQEREGRAYRLEIADSFWGQTGYGFSEAFLDLIREGPAIQDLQRLGGLIFSHLLTEPARKRIQTAPPSPLYLRLDEQLLHVPWELCYDGTDFLVNKFQVGSSFLYFVQG